MLSDDVRSALFARPDLKAKADGERVRFCCVRHEDRNPSAWMAGGSWGCFVCDFTEPLQTLAEALGVELRASGNGQRVIEATFDYHDEEGDVLYQVVRFRPKDFRQRRPDGLGGWEWKTAGMRKVLYRLPEVLAAVRDGRTIYIVEGEKHVERLRKDGLVATTNPGGAGKWRTEYSESLRGACVVILPDNDDVGLQHGEKVARALKGTAAEVKVVHLPGLPPKGDVLDWLAAGGTIPELEEFAFDAPVLNGAAPPAPPDDEAPPVEFHELVQEVAQFPAPMSIRELLEQPEPEESFIAEPFLPADANVLLAAYPKCFKTGFLLSLAMHAAAGRRFLGMFNTPREHRIGMVLMEDRYHRVRRRLLRFAKGMDMPLEHLDGLLWHWFRPPLVLSSAVAMKELARHVSEHELDLLVVDSWAYVSTGNPNDADVVTPQLMALAALRDDAPGLSVLLVHHARKTPQGSMGDDDERLTDLIRNSSAFGAWYDSGIVLSRKNETSPIKVRMELRDLPAPNPFSFTVEDEVPAGPDTGVRPEGWLRIEPSAESPAQANYQAELERLAPAVLEALRIASYGVSKAELAKRVGRRKEVVAAVFDELVREGRARYEEPKRRGGRGLCYPVQGAHA